MIFTCSFLKIASDYDGFINIFFQFASDICLVIGLYLWHISLVYTAMNI